MDKFKGIGFTSKEKMTRLNKFSYKMSKIIPIRWKDARKHIKEKYNREIYLRRNDDRYISKNELEKAILRNGNLFEEIEKLFSLNWVALKKIDISKESTILQDMETTYGNYIANGIIVHNSPAAGASIMSKDWKIFRKRILESHN